MPQRRPQNWEQRSPPPWVASAPVSVEMVLWTEVQDLRQDFEEFKEEVREELAVISMEVQATSRWQRYTVATLSFLWTDGGRVLIFLGMLLFALSGVTGQLPRTLATMLASFAPEK